MLVNVKNGENNNYNELNLFWCDCGHPIEERNIRFVVDRVAIKPLLDYLTEEVIVEGTICKFCSDCYTMQKVPGQILHLSTKDLSDATTRIIIEKEKHK